MIAVVSLFRSCSRAHVTRYFAQIEELARSTTEAVRVVAVEGDSVNDTREMLSSLNGHVAVEVVVREHGGPWYGSVDTPERMRQVSFAANGGLEALTESDDSVLYVESDLTWRPETILRLFDRVREGCDVVAPAVFAGKAFYDIWGYRDLRGKRFSPFPPYSRGLEHPPTEVSSAGSCLAMRGDVARRVRMSNTNAIVGLCAAVRGGGGHVYVDWRERVEHPS